MKTSIAITLIITAAIFCFVSGYSIGSHKAPGSMPQVTQANNGTGAIARAAENPQEPSAPAGGYGTVDDESTDDAGAPSPGYGAPSPGYGQ
jgi:hypothetical protein